ncbi:hypothetical protein BDF21DRAFT_317708, partial [Thamnidium elegans]
PRSYGLYTFVCEMNEHNTLQKYFFASKKTSSNIGVVSKTINGASVCNNPGCVYVKLSCLRKARDSIYALTLPI